jgi:hypothetical protein
LLGNKTRELNLLFSIEVTSLVSLAQICIEDGCITHVKSCNESASQHPKRTTIPTAKKEKRSVNCIFLLGKKAAPRKEYTYCVPYW